MSIADREHHSSSRSLTDGSATVDPSVGTTVGTTVCHYPTDPQFEALGYKTLLYLKYCFQGKAFPSGKPIDCAVLPAVRAQVGA
jgi:Golgi CORVET complex core vacuolar protein 8